VGRLGFLRIRKGVVWLFAALLPLSCATVRTPFQERQETPSAKEYIGDTGDAMEDTVDTVDTAENAVEKETGGEMTAGILLGFDDNYYAAWEAVFPLFARYGAKVTFFVQGNPAFCAAALARGHDIGYHTEHHTDLRKIPLSEWRYETLDSTRVLRENNIPLASFAYPFGFSETWMDETLLETYRIVRGFGVTNCFYTKDEIRLGRVMSKSIDNTVIQDDEDFYRIIGELCAAAKAAGNLIIPLTTHTVDDNAQWGIKRYRLEFLIKTAAEQGLVFYTYRELAGE
jgi:peptidoglycan/xylan/chitin deacetylase (PgdA/CDA1 family)